MVSLHPYDDKDASRLAHVLLQCCFHSIKNKVIACIFGAFGIYCVQGVIDRFINRLILKDCLKKLLVLGHLL